MPKAEADHGAIDLSLVSQTQQEVWHAIGRVFWSKAKHALVPEGVLLGDGKEAELRHACVPVRVVFDADDTHYVVHAFSNHLRHTISLLILRIVLLATSH